MRRTLKFAILLAVIAACVPACDASPQAKMVLSAPFPAQIVSGKKVFVSNACGFTSLSYTGEPRRFYDQFYAALKSWGHYELVSSPAEADLVFEISFTHVVVGDQFRLVMLDPGTRVVLWPCTEHIAFASRQANRDKNFDHALSLLVNDVRNVAGQPVATALSGQK